MRRAREEKLIGHGVGRLVPNVRMTPLVLRGCIAALALAIAGEARAAVANDIDAYVAPYAQSGNFSGVVRVERDGKLVFERAYGLADRERGVRNTPQTRFHIASLSMQITAAAILRLVDRGDLSLDTPAGEIVAGLPGGGRMTIRQLLMERSGLSDINDLPEYGAQVLSRHQTPQSLVDAVANRPLLFEPGARFLHEEHSAYNLLALVLEKKTGRPYAEAVRALVFQPLGMAGSGADDDRPLGPGTARGYAPQGVSGLGPADPLHWSAKTGNGSIFTTAGDEARWVNALVAGKALSAASRDAMLDPAERVGFGWFKSVSKRFDEPIAYMNGRSPGFGAFVAWLPRERLTVVALSNVYSSSTTTIGLDVAALALGRPAPPFKPAAPTAPAGDLGARFAFGPDFFQANAQLQLTALPDGRALTWPDGSVSPLIQTGPDRFIDRAYWEEVAIRRDAAGRPTALAYDRFEGRSVEASAAPR